MLLCKLDSAFDVSYVFIIVWSFCCDHALMIVLYGRFVGHVPQDLFNIFLYADSSTARYLR